MPFVSDKRLYLNADRSTVVDEDSADAAYLLVNEGGTVTDADAKKYGLSASKAKAEAADEPKDAESKQMSQPPENKARAIKAGDAA